jgi:hypothetical protein
MSWDDENDPGSACLVMVLAWLVGPLCGIGVGWALSSIGVTGFFGLVGIGIGWVAPVFLYANRNSKGRR